MAAAVNVDVGDVACVVVEVAKMTVGSAPSARSLIGYVQGLSLGILAGVQVQGLLAVEEAEGWQDDRALPLLQLQCSAPKKYHLQLLTQIAPQAAGTPPAPVRRLP